MTSPLVVGHVLHPLVSYLGLASSSGVSGYGRHLSTYGIHPRGRQAPRDGSVCRGASGVGLPAGGSRLRGEAVLRRGCRSRGAAAGPEGSTATGTATRCVRPRTWEDGRGCRALVTCRNSTSTDAHGQLLVAGGQGVAGSDPVSPTEQSRGASSVRAEPLWSSVRRSSRQPRVPAARVTRAARCPSGSRPCADQPAGHSWGRSRRFPAVGSCGVITNRRCDALSASRQFWVPAGVSVMILPGVPGARRRTAPLRGVRSAPFPQVLRRPRR